MNLDKAYDALDVALVKYKVVIYAVVAIAVFGAVFALGFGVASKLAEGKANKVALAHAEERAQLVDLKLAAEQRANSAESSNSSAMAASAAIYESVVQNEKALTERRVADLNSELVRLRVRTKKAESAAAGAIVPNSPAGTGASNGEAEQTLAGPVAARLTQRYADYNALIDQLTLCQAVVQADRDMFKEPKP